MNVTRWGCWYSHYDVMLVSAECRQGQWNGFLPTRMQSFLYNTPGIIGNFLSPKKHFVNSVPWPGVLYDGGDPVSHTTNISCCFYETALCVDFVIP